tara:strand:- start:1086 stop:1397 length:312 start_codon:yes stop_codon:yes gene_type:complete
MGFFAYCIPMIKITKEDIEGIATDENAVTYPKDKDNYGKKVKRLMHHQHQLHYFLELYYNKEKYTDSEREYYKKYTDHTYRKHLAQVAKLQEELNQFDSEAIL